MAMNKNIETMLEGLKADNVEVTEVGSLARYMSANGVLVKPYIGRMRAYIPMPSSVYGINPDTFSEEGGAFYKTRVSQSHLTFIPPEDDLALCALEKKLRRAVEIRSLSEGFMPMTAYDSLKERFQNIRAEYLQKRDEIVGKWDFLVASFTIGVEGMLKDIPALSDHQRDTLLKVFLSQIPKKKEYQDSFKMNLRVHAFPAETAAVPEGLSASIAADVEGTWAEEVVQTAILSIEKTIGDGWSKMLSAMRQYIKGHSIRQSSIENIQRFAKELSWKNVFKNPLLTHLMNELGNLYSAEGDSQADVIESCIAYTYEYAKETHLQLDLDKSPYKPADLESMGYVARSQMALVA